MVWGAQIFVFALGIRFSQSMDWHYVPPWVSPAWARFPPPLLHRSSFQPPEPTAMELMVDITNAMGISILQDHSYSSRNFAFSPYGIASVLVVLYEGACGNSARQIQRAMGLPFDNDIIRIGFRDIHRHLRSYFSHEGFLSGITLNKEASTLNPEYKMILKFYGYDFDSSTSEDDKGTTAAEKKGNKTKWTKVPVVPTRKTTTTGIRFPESTTATTTTGFHAWPTTDRTVMRENTVPKNDSFSMGSNEVITTEMSYPIAPIDSSTDLTSPLDFANPQTEKNEAKADGVSTTPKTDSQDEETANVTTTSESDNISITISPQEDSGTTNQAATTPFSGISDNKYEEEEEKKAEVEAITQKPESATTENKTIIDNGMLIPQVVNLETTTGTLSSNSGSVYIEDSLVPSTKAEVESTTITMLTEPTINVEAITRSQPEGETFSSTSIILPDSNSVPEFTSNTSAPLIVSTEEIAKSISSNNKPDKESFFEQETASATSEVVGTTSFFHSSREAESETPQTTIIPRNEPTSSSDEPKPTDREQPEEISDKNKIEKTTTTPVTILSSEQTAFATEKETSTPTPVVAADYETSSPPTSELIETTMTGSYLFSTTPSSSSETETTNLAGEISANIKRKREARLKNLTNHVRISSQAIVGTSFHAVPKRLKREKQRIRWKRTIIDYLKSPAKPDLSFRFQNGVYDSFAPRSLNGFMSLPRYLFLIGGTIDTPVPMMSYTNVFRFGYIPRLSAKALEFPLDDIRYKLLIVLPLERRGLRQMLYDMGSCSVRDIVNSIHPAKVRATIPTFMVEGSVVLTPSLRKLGIGDVFEPRTSNLSGMSSDPDLYVRNVEQSVTVIIRNYVEILDIQTRSMAARHAVHDFEASHPFVYFVLDAATNVALMAGQMLDPLSTKIY